MGVMPFLAACHTCVLMLYYIVTIVCYVCSFEWQIKFSLSVCSTSWLRGSAVERRSLAGELMWLNRPYAIRQPTRPTQPFIPSGSIDE